MPLNVAVMREKAADWRTDECVIRTKGAAPVFDSGSGYITAAGDIVYSGECRLRPTGGSRQVVVGETVLTLRLYDLTLPWTADGFEVGQYVTLTVSDDTMLVNRLYVVKDVQGGSTPVKRRLVVEDTLEQAQWDTEGS